MDRFFGIKRAGVKLRRNTYKRKKTKTPNGTFLRYVLAFLLVMSVNFLSALSDFDPTQPFKQDYIMQYEEET